MGDKPGTDEGPSLELPSLFGRKKRKGPAATGPAPEAPVVEAQVVETPVVEAPVVEAPAAEPEPEPTVVLAPPEPAPEVAPEPTPVVVPKSRKRTKEPKEPAPGDEYTEPGSFRLPAIPSRVAAFATGVLVGGLGAGLTALSLQACEAIQGTDSCGGPGIALLIAILVVMVLVGSLLLKAWDVAESGSASFLGVAMLCVVVLVGLLDALFSPWMFLVVPVLSGLSYAAAHWVTTHFDDPLDE